jgi:hypothetical protein
MSRLRHTSAMASIGCIVPMRWLAWMTLTKRVVVANGPFQLVDAHEPVGIAAEHADVPSLAFELRCALANAGMLQAGGDEVRSQFGNIASDRSRYSEQAQVDALGPTGSEDDLRWVTIEERGDVAARVFDRFLSRTAIPMIARRVPIELAQERQHAFAHAGRDRSCRAVVEVDGAHVRLRMAGGLDAWDVAFI